MNRRNMLMAAGVGAASFGAVVAQAAPGQRPSLGPDSLVAAADGTGLYVSDWGQGRPVVFLASLGLPSDMWDYQRLPLSSQGLRCIAYDRRGHGRSSVPGGGYDFDNLADDLAAVLDALDLKDAVLVGHSLASGEMVRYVTRHGTGRVSKLVFVSPAATPEVLQSPTNPTGPTAQQFQGFLNGMIAEGLPVWVAENQAPFFVPETPPEIRRWLMDMLIGTPLKPYYECNRTMATARFTAELEAIRLPSLVIHGDKDVSTPVERGRRTAALIPGGQFILYEGAPHGVFITHKDRVNADLLAFIKA
jgi:non-heme chloroperoxidase